MQKSKGHRYRFSLLTQELRESETEEYSACVLAFINCILAGAADLSKRVKLRNEFIGKKAGLLVYPLTRRSALSLNAALGARLISCVVGLSFLWFLGLHLQEILSQWRYTTNEALATQVDVFEDSFGDDESQISMPGGININSHDDMFNAVLAKVRLHQNPLPN